MKNLWNVIGIVALVVLVVFAGVMVNFSVQFAKRAAADQQATNVNLGALSQKVDATAKKQEEVVNKSVELAKSSADMISKTAGDLKKAVEDAGSAAVAAKNAADVASLESHQANETAKEAKTSADLAVKAANEAKTAADGAQKAVGSIDLSSLEAVKANLAQIKSKVDCIPCGVISPTTPITFTGVYTYTGEPGQNMGCFCTNWDERVSPEGIICWLRPGDVIKSGSDVFYSDSLDPVNGIWNRVPGLGGKHPEVVISGGKNGTGVWAPWGMSVVVISETGVITACPKMPLVKPGQIPVNQKVISTAVVSPTVDSSKPQATPVPTPQAATSVTQALTVTVDGLVLPVEKVSTTWTDNDKVAPRGTVCYVPKGITVWTGADVRVGPSESGPWKEVPNFGIANHAANPITGGQWVYAEFGVSFFTKK